MKYLAGTAVMAACLATAYAENEVSSPLMSTAFEFLARASSTSEVLTLNLTNLLILLVLKALILGIGFAGGLGGSSSGYSRSAENPTSVTQTDLTGGMCFMMYTSGEIDKLSCVQRSACEDPKTATDYLTAAKMWYKMHKLMGSYVNFNDGYVNVMNGVQEAVDHSIGGGECQVYNW